MSTGLPSRHAGPGLFDLQLNGYAGFDFNSSPERWTVEEFERVRAALARRGIAGALPTLITAYADSMVARAARYGEIIARSTALQSAFPRLHIEGPFISSEDGPRGAHPRRYCATPRALPDFLDRMREASGDRIGILTLAPELPGALGLIREATEAGIRVSIGHTEASAAIIAEAVDAGACMSTHLGNGSHQLLPRLDNYVQAQLAEDRLTASFIADGHHIPWYTLKNFLRAKTLARSILVSDGIAAADIGPGIFQLGDERVEVTRDLRVQVPGQPNLAGSALTLDRAVINVASHCGVSFEDAWEMASTRATAFLGLAPRPTVDVHVSEEGFRPLPEEIEATAV
jgi:N-acetylglucosamine-6-phosphate deacetylase